MIVFCLEKPQIHQENLRIKKLMIIGVKINNHQKVDHENMIDNNKKLEIV